MCMCVCVHAAEGLVTEVTVKHEFPWLVVDGLEQIVLSFRQIGLFATIIAAPIKEECEALPMQLKCLSNSSGPKGLQVWAFKITMAIHAWHQYKNQHQHQHMHTGRWYACT